MVENGRYKDLERVYKSSALFLINDEKNTIADLETMH